jgi:hypothetical protein
MYSSPLPIAIGTLLCLAKKVGYFSNYLLFPPLYEVERGIKGGEYMR